MGSVFLAGLVGPAWSEGARVVTSLVGLVLIGLGGVQAVRGVLGLGGNASPFPRPRESATLVERGVYGHVRHPIYGGLIEGAVGWGLLTASLSALLAAAVLAGFFALKVRREEAWLRERFAEYDAYVARTNVFIRGVY